jgi:homoserine kinase type II
LLRTSGRGRDAANNDRHGENTDRNTGKSAGGTDYILTLYEKRVDEADLPYFLGLVDYLSANGIACPAAIHGRDGRALRHLAGRPATLFTFLDGLAVQTVTADHCRQLGAGMAELHLAAMNFPMRRENSLSVSGWRRLADEIAGRADEVEIGLGSIIDGELDHLSCNWPQDLPRGIIHADLFPDNVFFLGGALSGFIDFYFACNDLLAYDLAICLNAWCFSEAPTVTFERDLASALISGYDAIRPLTDDEIASIPILARGAALRFLLTRLFDFLNQPAGALVRPKDPLQYAVRLAFHQNAQGPQSYGF